MLTCNAGRALAGAAVVVMVLACSSGDTAPGEDSTLPTVAMSEDSTVSNVATNNGTCEVDHKKLWGEIDTKEEIEEGLKQAEKLTKKGKTDKHGASTITPICQSHEYNRPLKPRLDFGQFVAVIDIEGADEEYSKKNDDVVYVWVYWHEDKKNNKAYYRAQFLSSKGKEVTGTGPLKECETGPAKEEAAHWTPSVHCPRVSAFTSHKPWWGCWLGCCYVEDIEKT